MSIIEDSYLDLEGSDDEEFQIPSHEIENTLLWRAQNASRVPFTNQVSGVNKLSNRNPNSSKPKGSRPKEQVICGFCKRPSTLTVGGKSYLCKSRTMPHLRICNACKSYEYRHGILIARDERKNKSRKRRLNDDGPSRKRQYYDPVEENPQEIESEPELYPFARQNTDKKIRALPKPPAALRVPVLNSMTHTRDIVQPKCTSPIPKKMEETPLLPVDSFMDIDDGDNDLGCDLCKKMINKVSQLIMCGECDKIFHRDCYALARSDYTILRSNDYCRAMTICCAEHEFTNKSQGKEKPPRSLTPLTIFDDHTEATRPNLTLSELCFDSIDDTDFVITPAYVAYANRTDSDRSNQLSVRYNKHPVVSRNFRQSDDQSLQEWDKRKLDMINPYLFADL